MKRISVMIILKFDNICQIFCASEGKTRLSAVVVKVKTTL